MRDHIRVEDALCRWGHRPGRTSRGWKDLVKASLSVMVVATAVLGSMVVRACLDVRTMLTGIVGSIRHGRNRLDLIVARRAYWRLGVVMTSIHPRHRSRDRVKRQSDHLSEVCSASGR